MSRPPRTAAPRLDSEWMADASCTNVPGLPWIQNPRRVPDFLVEMMAEVCASCPVLNACEAFAEQAHITAGFWAGTSRHHLQVGDFHVHHENGGGRAA